MLHLHAPLFTPLLFDISVESPGKIGYHGNRKGISGTSRLLNVSTIMDNTDRSKAVKVNIRNMVIFESLSGLNIANSFLEYFTLLE